MKNGRCEDVYGTIYWYKDDVYHREDGPAIEYPNGRKEWRFNGERHRVDGPAIEENSGYKAWYRHGKRHRINGPALIGVDGSKKWWVNGQEVNILAVFGYEPTVPLTEEEQMVLLLNV